jgi:hypothetical protein
MIRMALRIDSFSNSLAYLECIVSTSLKRIIWLKRPPYASARLRKNRSGQQNFNSSTSGTRRTHPCRMLKKAVQQGRSERRAEAYPLGYVEGLSDARTPLADFFSILLENEQAVRHSADGLPDSQAMAPIRG